MQTTSINIANMQNYFDLLRDLSETLAQLTTIEQQKTQAVREDDLAKLNECMKQEQVLSLTLRGYEQKRQTLLTALPLHNIPLSRLAAHVPSEQALEAKAVAEALLREYSLFKGSFEVAQNTLECNLHQIEQYLDEAGAAPLAGNGYHERQPELPSSLRTDFRA